MKEENSGRTKVIRVRLNEFEFKSVNEKLRQSSSNNLSEYIRKKIMDKPVIVYHRNQSLEDFMHEMAQLRQELNAIGKNYNQVVKRLNSMYDNAELKLWLRLHESAHQFLLKKADEIKTKINQINAQWLQ